VPLFWLTYHHPDSRAAGVVVDRVPLGRSSGSAEGFVTGADRGLEFASGHQLDPLSAEQIPANMIGRFLDDGDLRKLHQMLIKKKPSAPPVGRRATAK
jgi:hypothetical protein